MADLEDHSSSARGAGSIVGQLRGKLGAAFDLESSGRVLVFSAIVGVFAGLGAALFFELLILLKEFVFGDVFGYFPPPAGSERPLSPHPVQLPTSTWLLLVIPTLGGLGCGVLVYLFAPEAEGHGTDGLIKAFHGLKGRIRKRVPIVKALASILTIGTGGSAGREGPIAQIGAGFGSFLATQLRLSDWERRILMLCGAAGGVGAMFHAPLGGALFAVEVLYGSTAIEFSAIVPCIVSSVVAYSVFATLFGAGFAFTVPQQLAFEGPKDLPFFLVFAVLCAATGVAYIWFFYGLRDYVFKPLKVPNYVKPAIGGFLLGCIALTFPQVMAGGYGWIQEAIYGHLSLQLMGMLVLAKIVATSCTISSGGSGGVFAPSLFIGAMLGGAFGQLCEYWLPGIAPAGEAFVLVGMGGFFAGVAKVPLTALIMVSEMSGSYSLLVPLMFVSVICVAILSSKWSLYEEQVPTLVDSPAHLGDYVVDVLERMKVRDIYHPQRTALLVPEDMSLPKVLEQVAESKWRCFPVVDREEQLVGVFSLHDIRSALVTHGVAGDLILASDIAIPPLAVVTPDDNLHTTLRLFTREQTTEIPVVDGENRTQVICMLTRQEVLDAYDQQMSALRGDVSPSDETTPA